MPILVRRNPEKTCERCAECAPIRTARMRQVILRSLSFLALSVALLAQTPSFETVSIRLIDSKGAASSGSVTGPSRWGDWHVAGATAAALVRSAYAEEGPLMPLATITQVVGA